MWRRITTWVRGMTAEDALVIVFGASFFVGVWYALPMLVTYYDTSEYGGGVLRALESRSILPGSGVMYGTLTFYLNYVFIALVLAVGYVFFGFRLDLLKEAFILHPEYSTILPRITSVLVALVLLWVLHRFLKARILSRWHRCALLVLVCGNVLTAFMMRSGKMWMLSIALGVISFVYLYHAVSEEAKQGTPGRNTFISILTAFLATANFPFAFVYLINIPILAYVFPRTKESFKRLATYIAIGGTAFLGVFAANAANIIEQLSIVFRDFRPVLSDTAHPSLVTLSLPESLAIHLYQILDAFPLLFLALVAVWCFGLRDKVLAYLALLYMAAYTVAITILVTWNADVGGQMRHVFPIVFFLFFLIAAFKTPSRWISVVFLAVGLLSYAHTTVLLSVPSTYNTAYDFIVSTYGDKDIRIDNHLLELTLPMNKASYTLLAPTSCASACQNRLALQNDIEFVPRVVTLQAATSSIEKLPPPDIIVSEQTLLGCSLLARFGDAKSDTAYIDVEYNLGRMLMPEFYRLSSLGKNIYIYDGKTCTVHLQLRTGGPSRE